MVRQLKQLSAEDRARRTYVTQSKRWRARYDGLCEAATAAWIAYDLCPIMSERPALLARFFALDRQRNEAYLRWFHLKPEPVVVWG